MSDTPKTDAQAYDVGGYQHEDGSIVLSAFARKLERERDRLAEALQKFEGCFDCYGCVGTAEQALAAVKGENNE
jgi:hypothetical protein